MKFLSRSTERIKNELYIRKSSSNGMDSAFVHFGYHKALTLYFKQIYSALSRKFQFEYYHITDQEKSKEYKDSLNAKGHIVQVANIGKDSFSHEFVNGIHIVRDPKSILMSGLKYHKWCPEEWAHIALSNDLRKKLLIGLENIQIHEGESYQTLINRVSNKDALILELNLRRGHFEQMKAWDYNSKNIKTYRFEDIVGGELDALDDIASFLGLPIEIKIAMLRFGEVYKIKPNRFFSKKKSHVSQETLSMKDLESELFLEMYQELFTNNDLLRIGYQ